MCRNNRNMSCTCGALCVLLSLFLFRGSEVCFYVRFSYLVYFSTLFNLCVHVSFMQPRPNFMLIYTSVFSYCSLFLQFHCHTVNCNWISIIFKLISLNVKGLSNFRKRTIFLWCRKRNADFVFFFLQETHSTIATENH